MRKCSSGIQYSLKQLSHSHFSIHTLGSSQYASNFVDVIQMKVNLINLYLYSAYYYYDCPPQQATPAGNNFLLTGRDFC